MGTWQLYLGPKLDAGPVMVYTNFRIFMLIIACMSFSLFQRPNAAVTVSLSLKEDSASSDSVVKISEYRAITVSTADSVLFQRARDGEIHFGSAERHHVCDDHS